MTPKKPDLVIFDLDGTLADTIQDIAAAVNRILLRYGLPSYSAEAYKQMVGNGFRVLIERAIPPKTREDPTLFQKVYEDATNEYAAHLLDKTLAFPGVVQTLEGLDKKGVRLAVLSNKPDAMTKVIINTLFKTISFTAVWGSTPNRPRKPDPGAALAICELAEASPAHSLFVGDSGVDMQTGKAAGMIAVGALYGYRDRGDLENAGADHLISSPSELLTLLETMCFSF